MAGAFAGKVAVVTGGGSGIGEACARMLAARGAQVVVADLKEATARRVADAITDADGSASAFAADVSDPASAEAMVRHATRTFGGLDVAVNNAGIGGPIGKTGEYPIDGWRSVMSVNLDGVFYCMRYEIPALLARGGGAIVNMASILGAVGYESSPAYVAAKHAVLGLTKSAAIEYAEQRIRINSVGPAFIRTPLLGTDTKVLETLAALHPVKRLGTPEEVASLVCFLASDEASFITGSYHLIDGGYTAR